MYRWCVAAFSSGMCNIPTTVDQVLDGPVIQKHVKIDALCKQRWPPEQHPGNKCGHIFHLLCRQGPLRNVCLQQDSDHVYLWPGNNLHHNTAKRNYSGVVRESIGEWNGTLLSSVMRVGSVCTRVMDVHVYGVDLVSFILRCAFVNETQSPPQPSWCGDHQLQLAVTFGVSTG